jgi:hypothetical protein
MNLTECKIGQTVQVNDYASFWNQEFGVIRRIGVPESFTKVASQDDILIELCTGEHKLVFKPKELRLVAS